MHDHIYDLLVNKDEITWQTLILDLINTEQMDPWDVDVSKLTKLYMDALKQLQESNFFVSGKMLLAAALLLKIKSEKLVNHDITNFDSILYPPQEDEMDFGDLMDAPVPNYGDMSNPKLTIKTPMPRKRKVSISDLMHALKKALEVNNRRVLRTARFKRVDVKIPENNVDISNLIKTLYEKIVGYFNIDKEKLTFTELLPSSRKEDKIFTFIPLLHLSNEEKVDISQDEHFGEIYIKKYLKEEKKNG